MSECNFEMKHIREVIPGDMIKVMQYCGRKDVWLLVVGVEFACDYYEKNNDNLKYLSGNYQVEYWKKSNQIDIKKPTFIVKAVHLGGIPIFNFPDTTIIELHKNEFARKIEQEMFDEEYYDGNNKL